MSHLCWVFVLLAVVVVAPSDARPHNCQQRERSLADLDLAKDALSKAKLFYPTWEDEIASSNASECSKKDKSIGFIDVALDLISNAKKNIPICPPVPTEEPLTTMEEPLTTTEEPFTTTEDPTTKITTKDCRIPMDCQDWQDKGLNESGVYTVWPRGQKSGVQVRCDMDTDGGGWTVIGRAGDYPDTKIFDRDWKDCKNGFGNLERDFYIGNDNVFALNNQGNYSLRIDISFNISDTVVAGFVLYQEARIEDENANYRLHVGGFKGPSTADIMSPYNGQMFTTKDRDNDNFPDGNCAEEWKHAFWYDRCFLYHAKDWIVSKSSRDIEVKVKRLP